MTFFGFCAFLTVLLAVLALAAKASDWVLARAERKGRELAARQLAQKMAKLNSPGNQVTTFSTATLGTLEDVINMDTITTN